VIQEGEVTRLGGKKPIRLDARLLATTNRDLKKMVREGEFREDLFYRLNVLPVHTIPLRERPQDIELLARYFAERTCQENEIPIKSLNPSALERLHRHSWPGNVREMENVVQRSVLLSKGRELSAQDICFDDEIPTASSAFRVGMTLREMEQVLIGKTLELTENNKSKAAHILGITVRTLRNKLSEYRSEEES
jgi:DNA-binding NtrC family response regulator